MSGDCWFCGKPLKGEPCNKHHLLPKPVRRKQHALFGVKVPSHQRCHREWHHAREPHVPRGLYEQAMGELNWGKNIFAE